MKQGTAMDTPPEELKDRLLDAALPHVAFDGWSDATFRAAAMETATDLATARAVCPRGSLELALAYHRRGDDEMRKRLRAARVEDLRFRDRVATAVRLRIESITDKEAVRRGTALFALPQNAADGAKAIWGTADAIWEALGDPSDDFNWYTKRATLSGVYGATVLYWLGDESPSNRDTWAFLDRRIEDVMRIEKVKAEMRKNPVLSKLAAGPEWILSRIKPPTKMPRVDLPGFRTGSGGT
jgi:ubiquinone biosynthesis protein COQ9